MCYYNYRNSSFIVDLAMGQISRSTERISSCWYFCNFCQSWQWVTFCDPWPVWPISQLTRDLHDPWPMTQSQTIAWVDNDYLRIMMSSRLLPSILCNLKFWILLMQYIIIYSKSISLHGNYYKLNKENSSFNYLRRPRATKSKLCLTSYTFTPHLIMGQVFYGTDPWPTWSIHICRPIWPMTHDPLTHCLLWFLWDSSVLLSRCCSSLERPDDTATTLW